MISPLQCLLTSFRPLRTAADGARAEFKEASLGEITALDIPCSEVTSKPEAVLKRNEYITLERISKYGATKGCKACAFDSETHTPVCRARFNALIKADRIAKPSKKPVVLETDDKKGENTRSPPAPPDDDEDLFACLFADEAAEEYKPSPEQRARESDAPAPFDSEELEECTPLGGEGAGSGFAAIASETDEELKRADAERNRNRRVYQTHQVLFVCACSPTSQIGAVAEQSPINCVHLSLDHLDLANKNDVEQLLGQVESLAGCDIWASITCAYRCSWQRLSLRKLGESFKRKLTKQRKYVERMLSLALPVLQKCVDNFSRLSRLSVEWPKGAELWNLPVWQALEKKNGLKRVPFHGCVLDVVVMEYPIKKPWMVSTNCLRTLKRCRSPTVITATFTNRLQDPTPIKPVSIQQRWLRLP